MTPLVRGLIVAGLHVALTASLGAKLLIDRATRPRVWVQVLPVDPDSPLRGRVATAACSRGPHGSPSARH